MGGFIPATNTQCLFKAMTTDEICQHYKGMGVNDFEAITIQVAGEMKLQGYALMPGLRSKEVKDNMPSLSKYILKDHYKYAGAIVLNDKGRKLFNSIERNEAKLPLIGK